MTVNNKDTFADVAQQIAIGTPISSINAPGINVELFAQGLKIKRGHEEIVIDTAAGVLASDGQTSLLRSTNVRGDTDAFKLQSQKVFAFGQSFEDDKDQLAVSVTSRGAFIRYGDDLGNAVLISKIDDNSRGIALFSDKGLSAGEIRVSTTGPSVKRDIDNALTFSSI